MDTNEMCKRIFWKLQKAAYNKKNVNHENWLQEVKKTTFCDHLVDFKEIRSEIRNYSGEGTSIISLYSDNVDDICIKIEQEYKRYTPWNKFTNWSYRFWQ